MKYIALVIPGLDKIGGAEKQIQLLANGLRSRGWRVTVVCLSGSASMALGKIAGTDLMLLKMRHGVKDPLGWLRFVRWLRRERPDVVHAHLPHAAWLARWSRLLAPVRVQVDTIHSSATGTWGRRQGYKMSRWLPDCVTAVSRSAAENWLQSGMVSVKQLVIVPNGVEVGERTPTLEARRAARGSLGFAEDFEWLAVGRLEAVKDYGTMLHAFSKLPANARLTIAGDGAAKGKLRKLAEKLGIQERVRWLGFVSDLSLWYKAADALVLSSRWEGLPMGVLEAGAHGLPVVATDASGVREALPASCAEWLTTVGNAEALAERMLRMMELSLDERNKIGKNCFEFVQENYAMNVILDRWENIYERLLAKKS